MEQCVILKGMEDKTGGFDDFRKLVNQWLAENKDVEIISRQTSFLQGFGSRVMMIVTIFYREPAK